MTRTALILGGGGALGVSWATGVLAGLQEAGQDVTDADLIVGTSAGSIVATQVAQGWALAEMVEEHRNGTVGANPPLDFDVQNLMAIFAQWAAYPEMNVERAAEIGRLAIASKTPTEDAWIASFEEFIKPEWPDRDLRLTAVDAQRGEFRAWSRDDGIDIRRAVASSCAVPGMFPCVRFDNRLYQDGGVRSGTNADLAAGYDAVLILAPIGARDDGIDPLLGRTSRAEAEELRAAGSKVELAFPDAGSVEAMGLNRMDATRRGVTVDAGIVQGRALARSLGPAWSKTPA